MKNNSKFLLNLSYALIAQLVSLSLSIVMSLVAPKILGLEMYSYWQLFMFYMVYTNIFHFGISDGIYLRSGGKKYEDLNHKMLGSQFYLSLTWQVIIAIILMIYAILGLSNADRRFVIICTACYMLAYNGIAYFGMIFQAVNETKKYSITIILDKILFILFAIVLIFMKVVDYKHYVIGYIIATYIGFVYIAFIGRKILFQKPLNLSKTASEAKINIAAGMPLMLAAFASNFIVGASRLIVDNAWGIEQFGKFSFSISLTNFFLLFIRQVSMVMFPALKTESEDKLCKLFYSIKSGLNVILPFLLLMYYPGEWILGIWLPQYKESLLYLGLLLPLIVFDSKTQLLFITYMKAYREERKILYINLLSVVMSMIFSLIGAFVIKNINFIVISLVIVTAMRSTIMETFLSKKYFSGVKWKIIVSECILTGTFILITMYLNRIEALMIYFMAYLFYLAINKEALFDFLSFFKRKFLKNKMNAGGNVE